MASMPCMNAEAQSTSSCVSSPSRKSAASSCLEPGAVYSTMQHQSQQQNRRKRKRSCRCKKRPLNHVDVEPMLALVPIRRGTHVFPSTSKEALQNLMPRPSLARPYIVLVPSCGSERCASNVLGRGELRKAVENMCACRTCMKEPLCAQCAAVLEWAKTMPRRLFQILVRKNAGNGRDDPVLSLRVSLRSEFPLECFHVGGESVSSRKGVVSSGLENTPNNTTPWIGPFQIKEGDTLTWYPPAMKSNESRKDESKNPSLTFQLVRLGKNRDGDEARSPLANSIACSVITATCRQNGTRDDLSVTRTQLYEHDATCCATGQLDRQKKPHKTSEKDEDGDTKNKLLLDAATKSDSLTAAATMNTEVPSLSFPEVAVGQHCRLPIASLYARALQVLDRCELSEKRSDSSDPESAKSSEVRGNPLPTRELEQTLRSKGHGGETASGCVPSDSDIGNITSSGKDGTHRKSCEVMERKWSVSENEGTGLKIPTQTEGVGHNSASAIASQKIITVRLAGADCKFQQGGDSGAVVPCAKANTVNGKENVTNSRKRCELRDFRDPKKLKVLSSPCSCSNETTVMLEGAEATNKQKNRHGILNENSETGAEGENSKKPHTHLNRSTVDSETATTMSATGIPTKQNVPGSQQIVLPSTTTRPESKFVLYFVEKGTDMHTALLDGTEKIEGLKQHTIRRGAVVLNDFDKNNPPWPTHIVVSERVAVSAVTEALGFKDNDDDDAVDQLAEFLGEHDIVCVKRKWAARGSSLCRFPLEDPTMMDRYMGVWPRKRRRDTEGQSRCAQTRGCQTTGTDNGMSAVSSRNVALSQQFHKLSKLHQMCPLNGSEDEWRSYNFHLVSSRLRHLDFDIRDDPAVLDKLQRIRGIGSSTMQMVREYLRSGYISRIRQFEVDPKRVAMRRMMNIWGVGKVRAGELVQAGYETIQQVRKAVQVGRLPLDRNQFIGLTCYEDILEKMKRDEVEAIAAIVSMVVKEFFPSAELTIMGSYRRGSTACGDVDILVTHPDYVESVPPGALGEIVDELRIRGHIAYHLTFVSGMNPEKYETIAHGIASRLQRPPQFGKWVKHNCSSYMGVFFSPVKQKKHRRVDIKFYPYRYRVFAALYFTGNGYFNRSMRLWAKRKFNYRLSDHGLIQRDSEKQVLEASTEKEVFDYLGLVWREPSERDGFDAVTGKHADDIAGQLQGISRSEIMKECEEHVWIE